MRPSNAVLTIFSVKPNSLTTAWYASTSKPTGLVGSVGAKNSIGEYSMSTQFESSPGLMSDVGAAIGEAVGAELADGDAAGAAADGDAVAGAAVPEQPAIIAMQAIITNPRLTVVLTTILLRASRRGDGRPAGRPPRPPRSRRHLYHL